MGILLLRDGDDAPGGALYIGQLLLEGGLDALASTDSGGLNIYYRGGLEVGEFLGGRAFDLAGGGKLMPVVPWRPTFAAVPEPGGVGAFGLATMAALGRRRRACA